MAGPLADGLYERVVTEALAADLAALDRSASVESLDPADSHAVLARHLAAELERALEAVPHAQRPTAQIAMVNALLDELQRLAASANEVTNDSTSSQRVAPPARELL